MPSLTFGTGRAGHGPGTGPVLALAALLALGACAGHAWLAEYRPVVDSYRTDMAAYEMICGNGDIAQPSHERKSREQRDARAVTGLLVGAVIGSTDGMPATGGHRRVVRASRRHARRQRVRPARARDDRRPLHEDPRLHHP